jgi:hypothetical protein
METAVNKYTFHADRIEANTIEIERRLYLSRSFVTGFTSLPLCYTTQYFRACYGASVSEGASRTWRRVGFGVGWRCSFTGDAGTYVRASPFVVATVQQRGTWNL